MEIINFLRYNHAVRELYFNTLSTLPWEEIVKPRGASFDSLRNVFLHLTQVEDRWINYTILGRIKEWVDQDFEDFTTFDSLKSYMNYTKERTEEYLHKLTFEELNRSIVLPWDTTPDMCISVETALTHMVTEDLIHYGELSALLWQMDKEAPYLPFWRYMYNKQQPR
jgi:uncharacterized damage-inducible protein DinB